MAREDKFERRFLSFSVEKFNKMISGDGTSVTWRSGKRKKRNES